MQPLLGQIKEYKWVFIGAILFIGLNMLGTYLEFYYLNFLPVVFIIMVLAVYRIDIVFYLTIFTVPLSVSLSELVDGLSFDLSVPSELLIIGLAIFMVYRMIHDKVVDKRIALHPISFAIYFNLFWLLITSMTSSMPLVSFKLVASRIWFILVFYFLASFLYLKNPKYIKGSFWAYLLPLVIVIALTISNHLAEGLNNKEAAHFVMKPFYKDHTSYGAILAMYLPVVLLYLLKQSGSIAQKTFSYLLSAILIFAIVLSYTRAAWLSLILAIGIYILMIMRIKFIYVLAASVVLVLFYLSIRVELQQRMESNKQDSSDDLMEHVESMSNISTDDSNLERINRWNSAIRLFKERPVFGWGPGTYMFQYAPYQMSYQKTLISTNAGNRGNAHSEYIGPLAESGVLGSVSFILIVIAILITGFRVYRNADNLLDRRLSAGVLLGLITYFIHGFLNNFLDMDKANVPFWGFAAVMIVMDIKQKEKANAPKLNDTRSIENQNQA